MEPDKIKLSIVTININNVEGLMKTMRSVFSQTFSGYEYIIIDGGSTDGSKAYIEQHIGKLAYWVSENDNGIYHAMNKGIVKAAGEYLLFLNSGDYLVSENTCERMLKYEDSNTDLIYGNLERIFPNGHTDVVKMPGQLTVEFMINAVLCHPVTFIKKRLFYDYGLYDETLKIVGDWAFFLKVVVTGNASWKYKDVNVTVFAMDGLSSNQENYTMISKEKEYIKGSYFSFAFKQLLAEVDQLKAEKTQLNLFKKLTYKLSRVKHWSSNKLRQFKALITLFKSVEVAWQMINPKRIPIIINSYNRLTCLKQLIIFLENSGHKNIVILDNQSTYQPLLDFYKTISYRVVFLQRNYGHLALWDSNVISEFNKGFFVYTDPDVLPCEDCPTNFIRQFIRLMIKYPKFKKVGFGLKIDDLPDYYPLKDNVIKWETEFWKKPIGKDVYQADIDTTFALYAPRYKWSIYTDYFFKAIRTGGQSQARHLTWYTNPDSLTEEDVNYKNSSNDSASWTLQTNKNYQ